MAPQEEAVIRERFHALLVEEGFQSPAIPALGQSYRGSHIQTLWEFYLHATLAERASKNSQPHAREKLQRDEF